MKLKSNTIFLIATFILFTLAVTLFGYYEYRQNKIELYHQIDETLLASTEGVALVLPSDFYARAVAPSSITQGEDESNIDRLSRFAKGQKIVYIYTMIQKNGKIYFTASSGTEEERKSGINLTRYFDTYDDASDELKSVFRTQKKQFAEYTDKWGTFRSIFVPMKSQEGMIYVIGADIRIDTIKQTLKDKALNLLLRLALVLALSLPFFTWRLRQLNSRLLEKNGALGQEVEKGEKNLKQHHIELQTILNATEESIQHLATFDSLTGLPNRQKLLLDLQQHQPNGCALFNIDNFKEMNDFFGIAAGDVLLCTVGEWFKAMGFSPYRIGGDEFVILFYETMTQDTLHNRITALISALDEERFLIENETFDVHMSAGIAMGGHKLLTRADIALHQAKEQKIPIAFYEESENVEKQYHSNIAMASTIRKALATGRILCHYQPIVNILTGKIDKYETLVRMIDEEGTLIMPLQFLPIAKKTKLYPRITKEVIHQACHLFSMRSEAFSVNISIYDIHDSSTVQEIISTITQTRTASRIVFEILESEGIENYQEVAQFIGKVKALGAKIAIDDFGTGYSNFEHILKLDVDYIKIDGSLILEITDNPRHRIIVETIVDFTQKIGAKTIAEFVSDEAIYNTIKEIGIDYSQGYYTGKPEPLQ